MDGLIRLTKHFLCLGQRKLRPNTHQSSVHKSTTQNTHTCSSFNARSAALSSMNYITQEQVLKWPSCTHITTYRCTGARARTHPDVSGPVHSGSISQRTQKKKGSANVLTFNGRRTIITSGSAAFSITVTHSHTAPAHTHTHICKITHVIMRTSASPTTRSSSSACYTIQEMVAVATNKPESTISAFRSESGAERTSRYGVRGFV